MERPKISDDERSRQKQKIQHYAATHGLSIFEIGFGIVCRGRNNSCQTCYARALCDTSHDKNAHRHGYQLEAVYIIFLGDNGKISSKPTYAGVEVRNKYS